MKQWSQSRRLPVSILVLVTPTCLCMCKTQTLYDCTHSYISYVNENCVTEVMCRSINLRRFVTNTGYKAEFLETVL